MYKKERKIFSIKTEKRTFFHSLWKNLFVNREKEQNFYALRREQDFSTVKHPANTIYAPAELFWNSSSGGLSGILYP